MRKALKRAWTKAEAPCYVEEHHIFPVSIFGDNSITVCLTAREHYIAHALLALGLRKRYGNSDQRTIDMIYAFDQMGRCKYKSRPRYYSSRLYEIGKSMFSEVHSQRMTGESNPLYGKHWYTNGKENLLLSDFDVVPEGFCPGRAQKKGWKAPWANPPSTFGTKWVTNGHTSICLKDGEEVPSGFYYGRTIGWKPSQGKISITDGKSNRQINPGETIPEGWKMGMTKTGKTPGKGTIWINDGTINKRIPKIDPIPDGYTRGLLK